MTPEEAGIQIVGLVCGFPGERAWKRRLLMLKAYKAHVDGSGTGNPNILVLAGYIAPADAWIEFSKEWQAHLDHAHLSRFKMNEMSRLPEVAAWFYRVIEKSGVVAAISCTIRTAELQEVVRTFPWPSEITEIESLGNPYYFGFKAITDMTAQHQGDLGISEPIDFIFDDESEKTRIAGMWDMMRLASSPEVRRNMGDEPSFRRDERVLPLQAADLYAWWVRKWQEDGLVDWCRDLPFPWTVKRDIRRFHVEFGKADFITEFEHGLSPEARARWHITDARAALKAQEQREQGIRMTFPDPSSPWKP